MPMRFLRQYQFQLGFLATLVFCSVMVVRQINANQAKHVEVREAFILLYSKGYTNQSNRLYHWLLRDIPNLSNKTLLDDFGRTMMLVDPTTKRPENLIWKYHWTISHELENRSEKTLVRALKLADQQ
jgi:hypothetical protein